MILPCVVLAAQELSVQILAGLEFVVILLPLPTEH